MEIELFDGRVKAIIDPQGAWITNLSDEYGDVLFPKRTLTDASGAKKIRGGCHVCLPNFGSGGDSGQPQHGFGRALLWEVLESTATTAVLELSHGESEYVGLHSRMSYSIKGNTLLMTLNLTNAGSDTVRVAPGFHPYFMTSRSTEEVVIDDETIRLDEMDEVRFVTDEKDHTIETDGTKFELQSEGLSTWAKWTDGLGSYVCVEPTVGGFTFLNKEVRQEEQLSSGEKRQYTLRIMWQR